MKWSQSFLGVSFVLFASFFFVQCFTTTTEPQPQATNLDCSHFNVSTQCCDAIALLSQNPGDIFSMLSYSGKWLNDLGDERGCHTKATLQFCMFSLQVQIPGAGPASLKTGLCTPKGCSANDLKGGFFSAVSSILQDFNISAPWGNNSSFPQIPATLSCSGMSQIKPLSAGAIFTIILICVFAILLCVGTVLGTQTQLRHSLPCHYDVWNDDEVDEVVIDLNKESSSIPNQTFNESQDEKLLNKADDGATSSSPFWLEFWKCFSVLHNWQRLMSPTPGGFSSLNGLRFFSMCWVILGHVYIFHLFAGIINAEYVVPQLKDRFSFQLIWNAFFSVDSFFFLSGFLVGYFLLKELIQKGFRKMSWGLYYFHRIWRILPLYFFVFLVYTQITPYVASGPLWPDYQTFVQNQDYCWTNFLFINNFFDYQKMCMAWTWFLANDMQFYIITPIFIAAYYYRKWLGVALLSTATVICLLCRALLTHHYNFTPDAVMQPGADPTASYFDLMYQKPYTRIAPYLVGIATAFVYHELTRGGTLRGYRLKHWIQLSLWGLAAFSLVFPIFITFHDSKWPKAANVLYLTFNRFLWGCGLGIMFLLFFIGYGGILKSLFSLQIWDPLGKLTYGAYLLHLVVILPVVFTDRKLLYYRDIEVIYQFLGNIILAYGLSAITYLLIEKPFMNLEVLFLKRGMALWASRRSRNLQLN